MLSVDVPRKYHRLWLLLIDFKRTNVICPLGLATRFRMPHPLDVSQIDNASTDIHFLEVVDGAVVVVGRSYLAVVTRYGDTGHRLLPHLEKPSVLSVALCLTQAIREKWLAARNLSHPWPMFGRPRLFADLERCVPLAIVNHNLQENPKMLKCRSSNGNTTLRLRLLAATNPAGAVVVSAGYGNCRHKGSACLPCTIIYRGSAPSFHSPTGFAKLEVRYNPRDTSRRWI